MAEFAENVSNNGQLLIFTDLEGCAEYDNMSGAQVKQTTLLCQDGTFDAINNFLTKNTNNKVAFLGDYFDKGPYVVDSINNIVKLKKAYTDRVHIILGNRDVNKLRLRFELTPLLSETPSLSEIKYNQFSYEKLKPIVEQTDVIERFKLILHDTMGALPPAYDKTKEIGLKIMNLPEGAGEEGDKYLAKILISVFNETAAEKITTTYEPSKEIKEKCELFITNCRELFTQGKIVEYDEYFKVLLSHSGGFAQGGAFMFSNTSYYEKIMGNIELTPDTNLDYNVYYNQMLNVAYPALKKPFNETSETSETLTIKDVITYHNNLLNENVNFGEDPILTKSFILLQAMGLLSSVNEPVFSFIQACGLNGGCKLEFAIDETTINKMTQLGIKCVISGHQPHCATVPLIYKQGGVVFISNDTSNGYRPENNKEGEEEKPLTIENIPLSFIEKTDEDNFSWGITALRTGGILNNEKVVSYNKAGTHPEYYKELVKTYNSINDVPSTQDIMGVLYVDKLYSPLLNKAKQAGGKRSLKKKNKQSKKYKKQGGKRTKKINRKTRNCLHCRHH